MKIKGRVVTSENFFNILFGIVERILSLRWFNLWKTIYVNFRSMPFLQAIRFPIMVYGRLRVINLMGKIVINAPIRTGMIRLGEMNPLNFIDGGRSKISNSGTIIFHGRAHFFTGFTMIVSPTAVVEIGKSCFFSDNFNLQSQNRIQIGDFSRIGYGCSVMDSDIHFIVDTETRTIKTCSMSIELGRYTWITKQTNILKGAKTNDYTIILSGSVLNKDMTKIAPEYSLIAGAPAKLIKSGLRRVFNFENESMLNAYFKNTDKPFVLGDDVELDDFCNI